MNSLADVVSGMKVKSSKWFVIVAVMCMATAVVAEPLKIAAPPFYSSALAKIAKVKGFWKEEGLDVEVLNFQGGSLVNEAVLSGSVHFGMGVGAGPAIALASRNAKILVVAAEAYSDSSAPPELVVVRDDAPYSEVKQLDGKRVAIHAKGTLSHILLMALSARVGIKPVVLEIPVGAQWVALKRGDVDAVMTETPFPEQMKAEGARYLFGVPHRDVVPYLAATVTLTTQEFADRSPDTVRSVAKVVIRTSRWIMDHPDEAKKIIADELNYKPNVRDLISTESFKWGRNGAHMMPSLQWWGRQMESLGLIQQQPRYDAYFVTTFTGKALDELGRVPDPDFDAALALPIPE